MYGKDHIFQVVDGDPLGTKIYTLPNGLQLFMSVNKDEPRVQTYIVVKVGAKNDPSDATGLAHYFEHLMFKGTQHFGTSDYAAEKPILDRIENLFEIYRATTDVTTRNTIYHEIDSLSYEASQYAIPNEYDKLMATIGAENTNAFTSYDITCYMENIPSNQIENWAKIQSERFGNPVIRGFHTELETIYEEYNMSQDRDRPKMMDKVLKILFPNHPYGKQTILGSQQSLKNPSIKNVKDYYKQWYVPNNMAICVSGDFDPDYMTDVIEKYFGQYTPNYDLPKIAVREESPITTPLKADVFGPEAEHLYLAWRLPAANDKDAEIIKIMSDVLFNGKVGLLDTHINTPQLTLASEAGIYSLADFSALMIMGYPKAGQTFDEVETLLKSQVETLRKGEFSDSLVSAIINNKRIDLQRNLESNYGRASYYVDAITNGISWSDFVSRMNHLNGITKDDIVRVANKYLGESNYALIYKRQGDDPYLNKIPKPEITPIEVNRDASSNFFKNVIESNVIPIEPEFIDYANDVTRFQTKGNTQVYYTANKSNDIFQLTYIFDCGTYHSPLLKPALTILPYLGTSTKTAQEIQNEFYSLGCEYRVAAGRNRSYVVLTGLNENLKPAMRLLEDVLTDISIDSLTFNSLIELLAQEEQNAKLDQQQNIARLMNYLMFGEHNPSTDEYTSAKLSSTPSASLIEEISKLLNCSQKIIYYGGISEEVLKDYINDIHTIVPDSKTYADVERYKYLQPTDTIIYVAPYPSQQAYIQLYSCSGDKYSVADEPVRQLYNEYFGGAMNSVVFQELRERRSLAYRVGASYDAPSYSCLPYTYSGYVSTQGDKLVDAVQTFINLVNHMPISEDAFSVALKSIENRLRTSRTIKDGIAWDYIETLELGNDHDIRKDMYDRLPSLSLDDILDFQNEKISGKPLSIGILGNIEELDLEGLSKVGKVIVLSPEQLFGY